VRRGVGIATILKRISNEQNVEYVEEDSELLVTDPPVLPNFPIAMFVIAVLKDILDTLDLTGIGIILTTALSFLMALILFIWFLGKLGGGWWKKRVVSWLWARYVLVMVIECIPLFKIIPATTILILMAHNKEKKIVKLFNAALDELRRAGV
jgi:peptidoglycan biosynthesis protein MviN/MurJ (putative lipid II flippase)